MDDKLGRIFSARAVLGLAVLALGVGFFLDNLGILEMGAVLRLWPVVLFGLGVSTLVRPDASILGRASALVWFAAGAVFLAVNLNFIPLEYDDLWPLLLVFLGGSILMRAFGERLGRSASDRGGDRLGTLVFMSGVNRKPSSREFRGGEVTAVMGGAEIDLREAGVDPEGAALDLFVLWGGVDVFVPPDWSVDNRIFPFMGGVEDNRKAVGGDPSKRLMLKGMVVMGGVEIKN